MLLPISAGVSNSTRGNFFTSFPIWANMELDVGFAEEEGMTKEGEKKASNEGEVNPDPSIVIFYLYNE